MGAFSSIPNIRGKFVMSASQSRAASVSADPSAIEEIKTDAGLGNLLQVNSTPTFYINGRKPGILAPQYFDALIQLELQRSK